MNTLNIKHYKNMIRQERVISNKRELELERKKRDENIIKKYNIKQQVIKFENIQKKIKICNTIKKREDDNYMRQMKKEIREHTYNVIKEINRSLRLMRINRRTTDLLFENENSNNKFTEKIECRLQEVKKTENTDMSCKICYTNIIDTSFDCGHTLCTECAYSISKNNNKCHMCKKIIKNQRKIYV